jgi:hypothetical protein
MSKAQLVITAVVLEGRSKSGAARDYDVSRYWVQQLVKRYEIEGAAAFEPHSRRPQHTIPARSAPTSKTRSCDYAKHSKPVTTPVRPPSPNTWPATSQSPKCLRCLPSGASCRAEASRGHAMAQLMSERYSSEFRQVGRPQASALILAPLGFLSRPVGSGGSVWGYASNYQLLQLIPLLYGTHADRSTHD